MLVGLAACTPQPDLAQLQDPQACASCHPAHYEEWSGSMHAYASEDPLFRALNAKGQRETQGALGDFCVRCHAPLAVELGLTDDGLNLDEIDPGLLGVTCYFCHSVTSVEGAHNNPLRLATDGLMRGGIQDPVRTRFHRSRYSALLDRRRPESSAVCGSCHDIVTQRGAHIERTYHEWRESAYGQADQDSFLGCSACHMDGRRAAVATQPGNPTPERTHHAHTWPAVDVALTPFPQRDEQRALVQQELDRVLNPQLCVTVDPVALQTTVLVDVENIAAGHSFPSGAAAERRVWVQLLAFQGEQQVWSAGVVPEGVAVDDLPDPDRWRFGDRHFDPNGVLTHSFWEVETIETSLLPAPIVFDTSDPRYRDTHRVRTWTIDGIQPDRVEMEVFIRPFPLDVIDDLVREEGLDPAVRDEVPTFRIASGSLVWEASSGRGCARDL